MDIEKLKARKAEIKKKFNDLNEVKGQLVAQLKNFQEKIAGVNSDQIKMQGQFLEINIMLKELGVKEEDGEEDKEEVKEENKAEVKTETKK